MEQIEFSDNTHVFFTYDAQGRLTAQHRDIIALIPQELLIFSYGTVGASYTLEDAAGGQTETFFDDRGNARRTIDPRGNLTE